MKQFLKFTLAVVVGITLVTVIGVFVIFGVIGAIAASGDSPTVLKPNSVYQLELNGQLTDRSKDDSFERAMGEIYGSSTTTLGLDDILSNIEKAKNDPNIIGIYLKDGVLSGGYASIKEIRDALIDFKETGKFIIAYADSYTQRNYYLVSVADKVLLNTIGMLEWQGLASQVTFYKNTLEKLGIEMQIVRVGTFKSAVEPFTNTKMSDDNRRQVTAFTQSVWNEIVNAVSLSREISSEKLNEYADELMVFQPTEKALEYALVDSLVYVEQAEAIIKAYAGDNKVNFVKHSAMTKVPNNAKYEKNKVAVIYATGGIDSGNKEGIVSADLVKTIQDVAKNEAIKSVVFRINSPGGSAYGSEQIWHALEELKAQKPLIVSMGDYAASGGYYIACNADTILAQPNTLTGSIGVFGNIPNLNGLFEKLGLSFDVVKTNKQSDAISLNRSFTPEERAIMQAYVNRTYDLFTQRCAVGRGMTVEQIKEIAEGRVWTGEDALKLGLVDGLAGLPEAIRIAADKADLTSYKVMEYPEKENFVTQLMKNLSESVDVRLLKVKFGEHYEMYRQAVQVEKLNGIQASIPYEVIF